MAKVLIINGSPRVNGNTSIAVRRYHIETPQENDS